MLYPRRNDSKLSTALFKMPTAEYRGVPFWSWNTKITDELVCEQIAQFSEMGFGGAMIHARTGLETPYMSDEFMRLVKLANKECDKHGMLTWLYDEDRYPSGSAGGMVTKDIKYRARHLLFTQESMPELCKDKAAFDAAYAKGEKPLGYYLASYKVNLENGYLANYERVPKDNSPDVWNAYVRLAEECPWYNGQTYLDTLNKAAVEKFIELTHDKYQKALGDSFGKNTPAIFTDEPQMQPKRPFAFANGSTSASTVWTCDLNESYYATYGDNIIDFIPEIFWELPNGQLSQARYRFHDHTTERFVSAFTDTIGSWCQEHGIAFTGHLMSERLLLGQTLAIGEAMRHYRAFQIPGVDVLVGQLELSTIKQAASVAAQDGREGVISELYGVTEWDADFKTYKLQGDWQMALGVTIRNLHLQFMSMEGEAKRDWPASIGYQSPWWRKMSFVENYFARVGTALTRGKAYCKTAVIHPIESYWLAYGPSDQTSAERDGREENFENLLQWLLYGLVDFQFVSESLLPTQNNIMTEMQNPLPVGEMEYDTIIVPDCKTLRSTTVERLERFSQQGGKLLFVGKVPTHVDALPSERVQNLAQKCAVISYTRMDILAALEPSRVLDIKAPTGKRSDNLFYNMRQDTDKTRWLFLCHVKRRANRIGTPENYNVRIKGIWYLTQYDPMTGDIQTVKCTHTDGYTVFDIALYAQDSLLLHLQKEPNIGDINLAETETLLLEKPQIIFSPEGYKLAEPAALLLDKPSWRLDEGELNDADDILRIDNAVRKTLGIPRRQDKIIQPWLLPHVPAQNTVELVYTFSSDIVLEGCKLAIERSQNAIIMLNGNTVANQADGWYVDKAIHTIPLPTIQPGTNRLVVKIPFTTRTNLENLYILGNFGISGDLNTLTTLPEKLEFGDISRQGLPFYTGNIHYNMSFTIEKAGDAIIQVPHFAGTALVMLVDGEEKGITAYSPNMLKIKNLTQGQHSLEIILLGNRFNGFGTLHNSNSEYMWYGPDSYRTQGDEWTDRYLLRPVGILSRVEVYSNLTGKRPVKL